MLLLSVLLGCVALVSAQTTVDIGNGVHVPGAIPANLFAPQQHRLAYAGSGMTVSWSTFLKLEQPQVICELKDPLRDFRFSGLTNVLQMDCVPTSLPDSPCQRFRLLTRPPERGTTTYAWSERLEGLAQADASFLRRSSSTT